MPVDQAAIDAAYAQQQQAITDAYNAPPPPPRGPFGEIGTGIKRGALVGLPSLIGGALKYASEPGNALYNAGQGMVSSAEERGRSADLSLQPEQHNAFVNALASGGEMLAPSLAVPAAIGLGAAAVGGSPFTATALAALGGGALFGAEAGQQTLEKGRAAGLDEHTAREAARINAATTVAAQTGMGMIGGQMLGTVGRTLIPAFRAESASLAASTLGELAGTNGILKPALKATATGMVEGTALNAGQSALSTSIENAYGVDNTTTPGQAAAASVAPTLGLTPLIGPLALVSRAMNVRAAKTRTDSLSHFDAPEAIRTQLADVYAERLAQDDPAAAAVFRANAQMAIDTKQMLPVDSRLLTPDFIKRPAPTGIDALTTSRGAMPEREGPPAPPREVDAPDLSTTPGAAPPRPGNALDFTRDVDTSGLSLVDPTAPTAGERLRNQPVDNSEVAARFQGARELLDLHRQVSRDLTDAGIELARPLSREEFAATPEGKGKKGQALALAHRQYLADPNTQRDVMRRDAEAYDALQQAKAAEDAAAQQSRNPQPVDTPRVEPAPRSTAMADAMTRAIKKRDEELAGQQRDEQKGRESDAIANVTKGAQQAADAEAGRIQGDANAPKGREDIERDWHSAMAANDMDAKRQSLVPFMKRMDSMGVDKMATHAEQIAALEAIAADKKASQGMRDRASMLAEQWRKELPQEEKAPVDSSVEKPVANVPAAAAEPYLINSTTNARDTLIGAVSAKADGHPTKTVTLKDGTTAELVHLTDPTGQETIVALDANGNRMGEMATITRDEPHTPTVDVEPAAQRKGVASAMYDYAEELGVKLPATGRVQTEDGIAFNKARDARKAAAQAKAETIGSNAAADAVADALAGEPPKVALGENIPAKAAPDNAAPSAKLESAVASLPDNTAPTEPAPPLTVAERRDARMQQAAERAAKVAARRGDAGVTDKAPVIPEGTPVTDRAEAIADRIAELRAGFTQRLRAGEKLTPLEQERYDDLNAFAQTLNRYTEGRAKPADEEFVKSVGQMVEEASAPYKKSLRLDRVLADVVPKSEGTFAPNPVWTGIMNLTHRADAVLGVMAEKGSQPWVRDLAKKLQSLMGDTSMEAIGPGTPSTSNIGGKDFEGMRVGTYHILTDKIEITDEGASEATILHEATHAATIARIYQAQQIVGTRKPKNQQEARIVNGYMELYGAMLDAQKLPDWKSQYGMSDIREFVAELHSNPEFRDFLRTRNLWQRIVDGVRRMLGLSVNDNALIDRAMGASEALFSNERINETFDASPEGASHMTDVVLRRVISDTELKARQVGMDASLKLLRGFLPLQTVSYIAGRARAIPELVQSGFTRGLDAFQRANTSHDVILNRLNDVGSKYVTQVDRMLRGMDDLKARAVQAEMMTIGGEASRVGFDFRKNGRDNIAADKSIDKDDKEYIDEIHRRFTQLQRTNPEAARLLEEGERINRRSLIEKVATIAANLMDDRAGRTRRLEAELMRMDPADARYAEKQNQVKLLTTESLMAARFAKGLDLMDATLQQSANPDPVKFHDGATAQLGARLQATFDAARKDLPDGSPLKEAMRALESMYVKESKHPYFSLGRDGDFFVKVGFKNIDAATNARIQDALKGTNKVVGDLTRGDSQAFFRVRTAQEAQALHDKLVAAGEGKVENTAWGRTTDRIADASSVSPALRTLLSQVDDMSMGNLSREQADQVKQALTRQLLSMLPETAARNAQMGRRGIPGYDADFLTRFSQRAVGAVHDTAGIYTSRAYMAAAEARKESIEQLNRTGSADGRQRAQLIDDEINKRYSNMMKPMGHDWVSNLTSLSHSFYLGLSPAFFIRTYVQAWQRWLPFVGSKYGHMGAGAELFGAQSTSMKLVANSLKAALARDGARGLLGAPLELEGLGLNEREMAFIREMHANGKLDLGESSQLIHMAHASGRLQDAMRYAAVTAQYAEMANRFATGLAAFRLASKRPQLLAKGMTPESYAMLSVEMGMDDFSPANTARAIGKHGFAGPMTPLVAQFQNYNLQTMQQIARTVHDGFFGQDKSPEGLQRAKEARREFAGLMATTSVLAGTLGLPFANAFAGVYNTLMSDPDDPKDVRIAMRQWATSTFGQGMGTVLMKGLPSLLNVDTATLGQQGILPSTDFLADRTLWKERSEAQVRNALGPAVSLGLDLPTAVGRMMDGYWMKGVEAALPVGLRSFYKTGEMLAGDGYYTDSKGNDIPLKVGASDIAWRALGFQTESKSLQGEAQRDFIINQERLKNRRQIIDDQFLKATRDPSQLPSALSALQGFNVKNPMQPVTGQELHNAVSGYYTRFALGAASGTGIPVSRKQFPVLLGEEEHAAMPNR